jgi:hypothetical protein
MGVLHGIGQGFLRIRYLKYRLEAHTAQGVHGGVAFSANRYHRTFLSGSELKNTLN